MRLGRCKHVLQTEPHFFAYLLSRQRKAARTNPLKIKNIDKPPKSPFDKGDLISLLLSDYKEFREFSAKL